MSSHTPTSCKALILLRLTVVGAIAAALFACTTAYPLVGATALGTATAFVYPPATVLAIPAGFALGDLAVKDSNNEDIAEDIARVTEAVDALSRGDVQALVSTAIGKQQGFIDGLIDDFYALLKLVGIVATIAFLGQMLWTWKRKQHAQTFYDKVASLESPINKP